MISRVISPKVDVDTVLTKRILFVDHTANMGGGEIALFNLIRHIDRSRFTPIVLLFADGPLAEKLRPMCQVDVLPLGQEVTETRKDSLGIKTLLKIGAVLEVIWFCVRVSRFILQQKIDLVHTNSLKADLIGGVPAKLVFRPIVWHVRDRIDKDYLPGPVVWLFRKMATFIPSQVIANSAATLKALAPGHDLPSVAGRTRVDLNRISVVHDGIDAREIRVVETSSMTLGLIGRISPWKGQDIFIRAAAEVHAEIPAARFYIIGAALFGEHEYESGIRRLVESQGLSGVVEFTGFCANITERIEELDVVVHASTTGEPFGQVIIEGMAAGKPVIATNGGGVPEIVVDGSTGILVPMGDVAGMAAAMRWMLNNPQQAREMGRQGRERVLQHFTMGECASKVETVFDRVLRPLHSE